MPPPQITPPPGYTLDSAPPTPPPGYTLDALQGGGVPSAHTSPTGDEPSGILPTLKDFGSGVLKGAGNTLTGIQNLELKYIPGLSKIMAPTFTPDQLATHGTAQGIGKGAEQAAEFLAPGLGEEGATAKAAELFPKLAPLVRMGYGALTSGAVNSLQGGSFGAGAAAGGAASGIGEGLKALAPALAESAVGLRKTDRAYGRQVGRAILDETKGFSPSSVAESAQGRLNELNPKLESLADAASKRPNPARLALPPPSESIPLGEPGLPEMPGALIDAERFPAQNVGEARVIRNGRGQILPKAQRVVEFPDENGKLPFGRNLRGQILSRTPTRAAYMSGEGEALPPVGNQRVGPGTWMKQPEVGEGPLPSLIPNPSASLSGARGVVSSAMGKATRQNAAKEFGQLEPIQDFLARNFSTGEPIPEMVTPRSLLDLRRGFGSEFVHNWNPEVMPGVTGTARQAYHSLSEALHAAAPETAPLDRRISNLIPAAKRAESAALNAPMAQRVAHRVAAHTGALAGAVGGGAFGYERGGVPGAIKGAVAGAVIPEVIANPTFQMAVARGANSGVPGWLSQLLAGGALQATR